MGFVLSIPYAKEGSEPNGVCMYTIYRPIRYLTFLLVRVYFSFLLLLFSRRRSLTSPT